MALTLKTFAENMARNGGLALMVEEYKAIVQQDKDFPSVAFDKNRELDRCGDIKCYDHTRVVLRPPGQDYIHANYVDGYERPKKFICAQGPLPHTIYDFWRMIWQEECLVVVALTKLGGPSSALYFPRHQGFKETFGDIAVENRGITNLSKAYDATALKVTRGNQTRRVLQLTYYAWPDKSSPHRSTTLLAFVEMINYNLNSLKNDGYGKGWLTGLPNIKNHPIVVHGKNGVGRPGTLVALDICTRRLDATVVGEPEIDIPGTMLKLREQRASMIQQPEQFVFLHMVLIEYALRKSYIDPNIVNLKPFLNVTEEEANKILN